MNRYDKDKFNEDIKQQVKDINIDMPDRLKNNILKTLENLPDRKVKRKSKFKKVSGLVAGVAVCMLTFNIFMPAYAEALPIIGPTFKSINNTIGIGEKYVKGSKDINITKKYEDTTMTIKNIYYDGIELAIAYELKSEKGFDDKPIIFPIIKSGFKDINYQNEENNGEFVDDNTYVGLASYSLNDNQLSDKAKIDFVVNDLYGNWVGYYPEKFKFKLSVDSKDMGKETHNIGKEIKYDNTTFKIKDLITSKLNTIVYYDTDSEIIKDDSDSENFMEKYNIDFYMVDDKGMPVNWKGGASNGARKKNQRAEGDGYFRFDGISEDTKSVTIIPVIKQDNYYRKLKAETELSFERINKDSETIIKLETGEEYIIKNIDFKEDKTILNVKAKKYLYGLDKIGISIWDEDKVNKYKESDNGQKENWYKDTKDIEILEAKFNGIDDGYNFTLTLPALDKNKEYYIPMLNNGTKILEDEKITINLEKK